VSVDESKPLPTYTLTRRVRDVAANWLGVLGIVAFFLAWELATRLEILNPFYFPPFTKILAKGFELFANGSIWQHMWFSLTNFSVGFVIAVVLGVIAGVPMGWYRGISKAFDPLLSGIYATPLIALLPLIIMLFGLGPLSKIIMTVLAAVFPILINTMTGIANTDHRLITMSRAFGAKDSTIFLKVSVPGSLPYIVAGMRVALGRALVYIVVAEQYGAAMGLGYLSSVAAQRFQMAAMFVPIVIIACLGAGLNELLKLVENRLEKWKPQK
jgi:ABC-type nitrate/sulfonate/bicarbonate transport system permease component